MLLSAQLLPRPRISCFADRWQDFTIETLAEHAKKSQQSSGNFEFRGRLRVSLDVDGLEIRLKELDESTNMMSRLRISGQAVQEHEPVSGKSHKRILSLLDRIRNHADMMYSALSRSWSSGCHGSHAANLYLEPSDLKPEKQSTYRFRVCFRGMDLSNGTEMLLLQDLIVIQRLDVSSDQCV